MRTGIRALKIPNFAQIGTCAGQIPRFVQINTQALEVPNCVLIRSRVVPTPNFFRIGTSARQITSFVRIGISALHAPSFVRISIRAPQIPNCVPTGTRALLIPDLMKIGIRPGQIQNFVRNDIRTVLVPTRTRISKTQNPNRPSRHAHLNPIPNAKPIRPSAKSNPNRKAKILQSYRTQKIYRALGARSDLPVRKPSDDTFACRRINLVALKPAQGARVQTNDLFLSRYAAQAPGAQRRLKWRTQSAFSTPLNAAYATSRPRWLERAKSRAPKNPRH